MKFYGKKWYVILLALLLIQCTQKEPSLNTETQKNDIRGDELYSKGDAFYNKSEWEGAIGFYRFALNAYADSAKRSDILNDIGLSYKKLGFYDSARKFYSLSLHINKSLKDSSKMMFGLRNLGNLYRNQGDHFKALDAYLQSLSISELLNKERSSAQSYTTIGNVYQDLGRNDLALIQYQKAKLVYERLTDSLRLGRVMNNIGNVYSAIENYDSALIYYQRAINLKGESPDENSLAFTLHNKGHVFLEMGVFDSSRYYLDWAYTLRRKGSSYKELHVTSNALANLFLTTNRPSRAKPYLDEALAYSRSQDNRTLLMDNLVLRSRYLRQIGKGYEAYDYLKEWAAMRDSAFNQEQVKVLELQSQYDLKQKETERLLEEERADAESLTAQNRLYKIWLASGLALIVMIFAVVFLLQRNKIGKLNGSLKLLNRDMFHRKRNDYSRIIKSIEKAGFPETDAVRNMLFASNAVDDTLYEDLEQEQQVNLRTYFAELLEDLSESLQLEAKGIALNSTAVDFYLSGEKTAQMAFVISELITNSVKHSFESQPGEIELTISFEDDSLKVEYVDNGSPIPDDTSAENQGMGQMLIMGFLKGLRSSISRSRQNGFNFTKFDIPV